MSPPLPPSPPEGPPRGTNFSRRKATQPFPPSPAFMRIRASSINISLPSVEEEGIGLIHTTSGAILLRAGDLRPQAASRRGIVILYLPACEKIATSPRSKSGPSDAFEDGTPPRRGKK